MALTRIKNNQIDTGAIAGDRIDSNTDITSNNLTLSGDLRGPATFTIDPAAIGDNTGTVVIAGDLQVDGETTTINSSTLTVDDKQIVIASGATDNTSADGAGILIDGANAEITYDGTNDRFEINKDVNVSGDLNVDSSTLFVDSVNNRVGVGTGGPNSILHIRYTENNADSIINTSQALFVQNDGDGPASIKLLGNSNKHQLVYGGGIGSEFNLVDRGNSGSNRFSIGVDGDISFYEDTGTTPKFFWDASAERLGIGTSNPDQKLHVVGGTVGSSPATVKIETSNKTSTPRGEVYAALEFAVSGANVGEGDLPGDVISAIKSIDYRNNTTSFDDAGLGFYTLDNRTTGTVLRGGFSNNGGFQIRAEGEPISDVDHGNLKVDRDIYVSGGVYLGGTGSANYLEDYEEGTFTLSVTDSGNTNITNITSQFNRYVKVGRNVTIICKIEFDANNNSQMANVGDNLLLSSPPFVPIASSGLSSNNSIHTAYGNRVGVGDGERRTEYTIVFNSANFNVICTDAFDPIFHSRGSLMFQTTYETS